METHSKHIIFRSFPFLILLFVFGVNFATATDNSNTHVDSLIHLLNIVKADTSRINIYNDLANEYLTVNPDLTIKYGNKALQLSNTLKDQKRISASSNAIGIAYWVKGEYTEAIRCFERSLEIDQKLGDKINEAATLNNIGSVYYKMGEFQKATERYIQSAKKYDQLGDMEGSTSLYNNLGLIYRSQKMYPKALKYYQLALEKANSFNDFQYTSSILHNIGTIYFLIDENDRAMEYFKKSLELKEQNNNKLGLSSSYEGMGAVYANMQKIDSALSFYYKALAIMQECGDSEGQAHVLNNIGNNLVKKGRYSDARKSFERSLQIGEEINTLETQLETHELLSQLDSLTGDFKSAFNHYKKFKHISDQVYNVEKRDKIIELQTRYELEKKEQELEILTQQNEQQQYNLARKRLVIAILLGFIILSFISIYAIYRYTKFRINQKINQLTHENLRQQLNPHFVFNTLNSIQNFVFNNNKLATIKYIGKFAKLIRLILENTQTTVNSIENEINGLRTYLELEKLRFKNQIEYSIRIDKNIDTGKLKIPTMLLQPFVENSLKHGLQNKEGKGRVEIDMALVNNHIQCIIEDNGIGRVKAEEIKEKRLNPAKSYGTFITEERIRLLNTVYGNKLRIEFIDLYDDKLSPQGTRVELDLPILN